MQHTAEWYTAMSDAIKLRDKALAYIESWNLKLGEAEQTIALLAAGETVPTPTHALETANDEQA